MRVGMKGDMYKKKFWAGKLKEEETLTKRQGQPVTKTHGWKQGKTSGSQPILIGCKKCTPSFKGFSFCIRLFVLQEIDWQKNKESFKL